MVRAGPGARAVPNAQRQPHLSRIQRAEGMERGVIQKVRCAKTDGTGYNNEGLPSLSWHNLDIIML